MLENPGNWVKHYHGNDHELAIKRKYPGSGFVMVPSFDIIKTYKLNGNSYMY